MIAEILKSYAMVLDYARRMLADVDDDKFFAQPVEGMNHPAWIIGHLVYSCQMIGGELGVSPWLPERWIQLFATGSAPVGDKSAYPDRSSLMQALDDGQKRLTTKLSGMSEEDLRVPLPDEKSRKTFPTLEHAVLHILTVHTSIHVGQLATWRRAMGLPKTIECT
jgi:hypothetical protein